MNRKSAKKIALAMSTPFQVNFFYPLIERLSGKIEFIILARDHDRIIPMLEAKKLDYAKVGKHGGKTKEGKLLAYAKTIQKIVPILKREKPDILLTERWPEAVRAAFGLGIPAWTLFYDDREYYVNRMVFPLSSKIFAPKFYTVKELRQGGVVDIGNVAWFNGCHACYLKDYKADPARNPFKELGLKSPIILIRPEPEFTAYFPKKQNILEDTTKLLTKTVDATIVVMPRTKEQTERYKHLHVKIVDEAFAENPVAYADVIVGAAETMIEEAFVLGTPAISVIYWEPSKSVKMLHKYIHNLTDPEKIVKQTTHFINLKNKMEFVHYSQKIVSQMDNPIDKIIKELEVT